MDTATTITVVLLALLVPSGTVLALEAFRARRRQAPAAAPPADPLEGYLGHELVVHTRRPDDQSVRGILRAAGPVWLELVHAAYLPESPHAEVARAEGLVLVPRRHVSSLQVLKAGTLVTSAPEAEEPERELEPAAPFVA